MEPRKLVEDTYTLSENVKEGKKSIITHYNTSTLFAIGDDLVAEDNNIIYEYLDILNQLKYEYTFTEDEKSRYYMRPDLFCYDKYSDINLDFIILAINDIISDKEFTKSTIYMIDRDTLLSVISSIINAEDNLILFNRRNYKNGLF